MKKLIIILICILSSASLVLGQDCFRFTYLELRKNDKSEKNYLTEQMSLDFDGKTSFYYSEVSFKRDSLDVLAFDKSGNIKDEDAYGERTRLSGPATDDKSFIDFSKATFMQIYNPIAFFEGTMPIEMPQWELTGEEEEQSGYQCKIAKGEFLGRDWKVWFTEEVPVNVGPWFLWGAPGLIVLAEDAEGFFQFRLLGVEKIKESRLDNDLSYLQFAKSRSWKKIFSMPSMKEMETLYSKYMRDTDFFNKIHGITGGYSVDRNGNKIPEPKFKPYEPLISDEYWKKK